MLASLFIYTNENRDANITIETQKKNIDTTFASIFLFAKIKTQALHLYESIIIE